MVLNDIFAFAGCEFLRLSEFNNERKQNKRIQTSHTDGFKKAENIKIRSKINKNIILISVEKSQNNPCRFIMWTVATRSSEIKDLLIQLKEMYIDIDIV